VGCDHLAFIAANTTHTRQPLHRAGMIALQQQQHQLLMDE
jgi:hypothetical protein